MAFQTVSGRLGQHQPASIKFVGVFSTRPKGRGRGLTFPRLPALRLLGLLFGYLFGEVQVKSVAI
jgi:hypothetical protein